MKSNMKTEMKSDMKTGMTINLHIERLVLDDVGVQARQRDALKAAVETALRQQFVNNQGAALTAQQGTSRATVDGGSIAIENNQGTERLGQQIGQAIYQGIESKA